jgi:hypothetical protein
MHSCFSCAFEAQLSPAKFVSTLAPTCPGSHGGHIHKQDQPWPEHGAIVCCQTRSLATGRKLCSVQKAAANSARCLHQFLASEHATMSSMFNSSKTEHSPSRVLRPDNIRWMMSLSDLRTYLCSFLPAFPALHKCSPLLRFPASEGMKTRKMIFRECPPTSRSCPIYSQNKHSYLRFFKLQLKLHPRYHNNFSSLHPIHQHGIQWRTSPSPDRLRPFGRQSSYRDWYANHPFPPYLTLLSPQLIPLRI